MPQKEGLFFKAALAKSLSNFQIDYLQFLWCLTSSKCFVFLVLLISLHFSYVLNLTVHYWWLLVKAHSSLSSSTLYYDVMNEDFGIRKKKISSLGNPQICDFIGQYKPKSVPSTIAKTILEAAFEFKALGYPLIKAFSSPKFWGLWGGSKRQPIWKKFFFCKLVFRANRMGLGCLNIAFQTWSKYGQLYAQHFD